MGEQLPHALRAGRLGVDAEGLTLVKVRPQEAGLTLETVEDLLAHRISTLPGRQKGPLIEGANHSIIELPERGWSCVVYLASMAARTRLNVLLRVLLVAGGILLLVGLSFSFWVN